MKRQIAALGIMAMVLMCGCAKRSVNDNTSSQQDSTTEETTTASVQVNLAAPLSDYVSAEAFAKADMWDSCDDSALAAVMRKAANKEKVVIACIGGSITQGTISKGSNDSQVSVKKPYAEVYFDWWRTSFPDTEFQFVNAGIGGTDSYLGVHRVDKHVLDFKPDLVLVEYSVNDSSDNFYKRSYDNLVRKILLSESKPAVMLLYMSQSNGTSAQTSHVFVGHGYNLPMVSYGNTIGYLKDENIFTEKELSGDTVHPSALGHAITGEIIWKYLNNVFEHMDEFDTPKDFDMKAITKERYLDATILDSSNITPDSLGTFAEKKVSDWFPNGWTCNEGDGEITFTTEFANLGILYLDTVNGNGGKFDIYIDDEKISTIDADFPNGWGNAITADEVYVGDGRKTHKITIKKNADSAGDVFNLLGLLIS